MAASDSPDPGQIADEHRANKRALRIGDFGAREKLPRAARQK
jgi:hypothetical protein